MSELEVVKHTRNLVQIVKNKGHWKHKAADIGLEILIIVFAITLSLIVERWREGQQERKLEHNFLTNLKGDLKGDLQQLKEDSVSYTRMRKALAFYRKAYEKGEDLNVDSANAQIGYLYNTVGFVQGNSRYEALKASGKLDVIENKNLQIDIVNLYQITIPSMTQATDYFTNMKVKMGDIVDHNLVVTKKGSNIQQLMRQPEFYNLINKDSYIDYILMRYRAASAQTRRIIKEIETEENDW